jgi:hypothetical protein
VRFECALHIPLSPTSGPDMIDDVIGFGFATWMNRYVGLIAVRMKPCDLEELIGCSALSKLMGCDRKVKVGEGTTSRKRRLG